VEVKSNLAINRLGREIGALAVELSLEKEREGLFYFYFLISKGRTFG